MDTTDTIVPAPPTPRPRHRRRRIVLAVIVVLILAVDIAGITVTLPYFALSPGSATAVSSMIAVPAAKRHAIAGPVLMTDVYVNQVRPIDLVFAWLNRNVDVVSSKDLLGNASPAQLKSINDAEMRASQEAAEVVALRRLGYTVPEHGTGALVEEVFPDTPASGRLAVGDTIVAIDGHPVQLDQDLSTVLAADHPDQPVTLQVENQKRAPRTVALVLGRRPGQATQPFIGVGLGTRDEHFDFPFAVSIDSQGIGGPSAGLAFTLGLLDALGTGHLTGGRKVAATGTIELDGTVGDVGGVAQKAVSVSRAGATLFLVPPEEYRTALAHVGPGVKVVAVKTLDDALRAIAANGGDLSGLPPVPAAPQ